MKIKLKNPITYFVNGQDKFLPAGEEFEALVLSNGDAVFENPHAEYKPGTTFTSSYNFDIVSDSVSKAGVNQAFASLRDLIGQDLSQINFKTGDKE